MTYEASEIDQVDAERHTIMMGRLVRAFKVAGRIEAESPYATLNLSDQTALARIGTPPGAIMRDVAQELDSALSTATTVVDRLVKRGLVRRERDEANRRVVRLGLTDEGRRLIDRLSKEQRASSAAVLATLEPEERKLYLDLLEKIAYSVDKTGTV